MRRRECVMFVVLAACSTQAGHDELRTHGCIWPSMAERARGHVVEVDGKQYEGKVLPRAVRILGPYTDRDGFALLDEDGDEQVKVVFLPDTDGGRQWVPVKRKSVKYVGCGPEVQAFIEIDGQQ